MDSLIAIAVGSIAGAHTATWGMYKDAPHEGFELRKYVRSILLSALIAFALVELAHLPAHTIGDLMVLFGVTYGIERAVGEFYKTFVREEDQSKYFIPMQFAVKGKVIESRRTRLLIGCAHAVGAAALLAVALIAQSRIDHPATWLLVAVGSVGGWVSAFGGAWKDAPHEGFEIRKFFRSPVCAALYAFLLSQFTDSLVLCALGGLGFTIATLETYKTFFFPSKPRGKFTGKPVIAPKMLWRRQLFVPAYIAIWMLIVAGFVAGGRQS